MCWCRTWGLVGRGLVHDLGSCRHPGVYVHMGWGLGWGRTWFWKLVKTTKSFFSSRNQKIAMDL